MIRLGFAVKVLGEGGLPSHDTRRWQSGPHLRVSLGLLGDVFDYLERIDVRCYRMATALAPYASHPELPQFHRQVEECGEELAATGARARAIGLRLSTHPGQYTVLNSREPQVRANAAAELEVQASLLDAMGLGPEAVVVLHVGGLGDGPADGIERFERGFEALSEAARSRLVIENDDRAFALVHVLELARRIGRPVVFDAHHHFCLDPAGIPEREALALAAATWPAGVRPKAHFSSPRTQVSEAVRKVGRRVERRTVVPELRAHADLVDPISFMRFAAESAAGLELDVMLEAKAKDLALLRLREQLAARGVQLA